MRKQHDKLRKPHSTKAERVFAELLKELHIPFRTKVKIGGKEVDFIIGKVAIEIDGHLQDAYKNISLFEKGYTPIHFNNQEIIINRNMVRTNLLNIRKDL